MNTNNFDMPITITTVKTYTKFTIKKINIPFEQDAEVEVMIMDTEDNIGIYETIIIPKEIYTGWFYSTELVIEYCKNYLQNKYNL
jgi:hypothetical protein